MGSVCAEQQHHKFNPTHHHLYKKSPCEIDIPPRKLLSRRAEPGDLFVGSPRFAEDAVFQKFLPCNNIDDEDSDPYSSDHFRMYEFKVRRCNRSRSHDWTDCPFAHPGEKASRRDPRKYHYSGTVCSDFRRGSCSRGDNCEFAHGVFECWLHPNRYRTEACKDGKNCKRKVCFFAHTPKQLRILPADFDDEVPPLAGEAKYGKLGPCCAYCHSTVTASPTSTLMGLSHLSPPMSPSLSPPISPSKTLSFSPLSRMESRSYKDSMIDLMVSLDALNMNESVSNMNAKSWVHFNGEDQQQFVLSPSTPAASNRIFGGEYSGRNLMMEDSNYSDGGAGPDFGWVNDLLT